MRAEHGDRAGGNLRKVLDEAGPLGTQALDHMTVMDNFVPDVDRHAELLQRLLDDVDGPDHAGAEPARLGKDHTQGDGLSRTTSCKKSSISLADR